MAVSRMDKQQFKKARSEYRKQLRAAYFEGLTSFKLACDTSISGIKFAQFTKPDAAYPVSVKVWALKIRLGLG